MLKSILNVVPGDVILEGSNRTEVRKVEYSPGGCKHKVHINDKDCYEGFAEVRVQDKKESKDA